MIKQYTGELWGYCRKHGWTIVDANNQCELCKENK